jgi:hypothetical protein
MNQPRELSLDELREFLCHQAAEISKLLHDDVEIARQTIRMALRDEVYWQPISDKRGTSPITQLGQVIYHRVRWILVRTSNTWDSIRGFCKRLGTRASFMTSPQKRFVDNLSVGSPFFEANWTPSAGTPEQTLRDRALEREKREILELARWKWRLLELRPKPELGSRYRWTGITSKKAKLPPYGFGLRVRRFLDLTS